MKKKTMKKPKPRPKKRPAKALPVKKASSPIPAFQVTLDPTDARSMRAIYQALDEGFGNVTYMLERLGLSRMTFYRHLKEDAALRETFAVMERDVAHKVKDLLLELATKGEMQYVYYGGRRVDVRRVPNTHLLLRVVMAYFPEFKANPAVTVNVPPGGSGGSPEPVNPNLKEWSMTEEGNRMAHEMLLRYLEYCEQKGIKPNLGEDWTPEAPTPERPLPKAGDDEKLEKRKGLKLLDGRKDEEDENDED